MSGSSVTLQGLERRSGASFGGVVPSSAVARDAGTLVAALCVEHHSDGAVVPLLVLSEAPGVLAPEALETVSVRDDRGRDYRVVVLNGQSGLGTLQASLWIAPPLPADARRIDLTVPGLARTAPARGGGGVTRPLAGGPWSLAIDLVPSRTTVPVPARPDRRTERPGSRGERVPARALAAFRGLVPVGQARVSSGEAVCLWALERYQDLALLTLAVLDGGGDSGAPAGDELSLSAWDDRGRAYAVTFLSASAAQGWCDLTVRLEPAIDPAAERLGVRVAAAAEGAAAGQATEFLFGVALPPA
jgi:hypothetical protein